MHHGDDFHRAFPKYRYQINASSGKYTVPATESRALQNDPNTECMRTKPEILASITQCAVLEYNAYETSAIKGRTQALVVFEFCLLV